MDRSYYLSSLLGTIIIPPIRQLANNKTKPILIGKDNSRKSLATSTANKTFEKSISVLAMADNFATDNVILPPPFNHVKLNVPRENTKLRNLLSDNRGISLGKLLMGNAKNIAR